MDSEQKTADEKNHATADKSKVLPTAHRPPSTEHGGPKGPEPTRYGDWEIGGKCVDF